MATIYALGLTPNQAVMIPSELGGGKDATKSPEQAHGALTNIADD